MHYRTARTLDYIGCGADEHPVGCQLFGARPDRVGAAAAVCVEAGADLVDINMACPVRKVVRPGPARPCSTIRRRPWRWWRAVSAAGGDVPVTVKLRAGMRPGDRLALAVGPRLAEAGAAALCLHPRSAAQLYRGAADHGLTEKPGRACGCRSSPPATSPAATPAAAPRAGAAAVMVARAAIGRPWVFAEILEQTPDGPGAARRAARFVAEAWPRGPRSRRPPAPVLAPLPPQRHAGRDSGADAGAPPDPRSGDYWGLTRRRQMPARAAPVRLLRIAAGSGAARATHDDRLPADRGSG